jgi:hypothetical protein
MVTSSWLPVMPIDVIVYKVVPPRRLFTLLSLSTQVGSTPFGLHSFSHYSIHSAIHSFSHTFIHSFSNFHIPIMRTVATLAALVGIVSLSFASPVDKSKRGEGAFTVQQVDVGKTLKVGSLALQKAYKKYTKTVPTHIAAAAASAAGTAASGAVSATPEQYDSEYLCPVTIGTGGTLNLDFDTGSADL